MLLRLAEFERFAEEKAAVAEMVTQRDTWYNADLERVDLSFIADLHRIVKVGVCVCVCVFVQIAQCS